MSEYDWYGNKKPGNNYGWSNVDINSTYSKVKNALDVDVLIDKVGKAELEKQIAAAMETLNEKFKVQWNTPKPQPVVWTIPVPDPIQIPTVYVPPVMRCEYTIIGMIEWYPWEKGGEAIRTIDDLFTHLDENPFKEHAEVSLRRVKAEWGFAWFDPAQAQRLFRFVPDTNYAQPTTGTYQPPPPNKVEEVVIPPATPFEREFV